MRRSWWLAGSGDTRVVLTTEPERFDAAERLHQQEVRSLIHDWLADRTASLELASIFSELTHTPQPPVTWTQHQLGRVVGRFVEDACASGWLVPLRPSLAQAQGRLPKQPQPPPKQPSQPPGQPPTKQPKQPFSLTKLNYPPFIAAGSEDPQPSIEWTIVDPSVRITSGKIEIFRSHSDTPDIPIFSRSLNPAELAAGDHAWPWDGEIGTHSHFPQRHTSVEFSPYIIKLSVTDGSETKLLETSFRVVATQLAIEIGEDDLLERTSDKIVLSDIKQSFSGPTSDLEIELTLNKFPITNGQLSALGGSLTFLHYESEWGQGPRIPLVASVLIRNSQGGDVLAPKAWGRRMVFWSFKYVDLNQHVGGPAGDFVKKSADYLAGSSNPAGKACHQDRGGKRSDSGGGHFFTTAGTTFPVKSPQSGFAGRHSGPVTQGSYKGKTAVLFSPARQAGEGYVIKAMFDPRATLDAQPPPAASLQATTGTWSVRRRVTIAKLFKKTATVPEVPSATIHHMQHFRQAFVNLDVPDKSYHTMDRAAFNQAIADAASGLFANLSFMYIDPSVDQYNSGNALFRLRTFAELQAFAQALPATHPRKAEAMALALTGKDAYLSAVPLLLLFGGLWEATIKNLAAGHNPPEGIAVLVFEGQTNHDAYFSAQLAQMNPGPKNTNASVSGVAPATLDSRRAIASVNSNDVRTMAHELGHCLFLAHADAHDDINDGIAPSPQLHDAESPHCLMNYDPSDHQLCGLCQLRLRGWDTRALSNKAGDNQKADPT